MTDTITLLTTDEAAAVLRSTRKTLERWRYVGTGPVYVRVGAAVRYRLTDLDAWLDQQTVTPTY